MSSLRELRGPKRLLMHFILTEEWQTSRQVAERYYTEGELPYRARQAVQKHLTGLADMGLVEKKKGVAYSPIAGKANKELRETYYWRLPP